MWETWDSCTCNPLFFQSLGTFHDKELSSLAPNTHLVAPAKPSQQGKNQWHNHSVTYEVIHCPHLKRFFQDKDCATTGERGGNTYYEENWLEWCLTVLLLYFHLLSILHQKKCNSVQLFSKLFDEVEKIRCWKVQTDSDATEKERKLQENKRIIENQSRTIQELQVYVVNLLCLTKCTFFF